MHDLHLRVVGLEHLVHVQLVLPDVELEAVVHLGYEEVQPYADDDLHFQ